MTLADPAAARDTDRNIDRATLIRGRDGRVMASVSVVGDSARMRAMMRRATALVIESAGVISRRLGYCSPPPP